MRGGCRRILHPLGSGAVPPYKFLQLQMDIQPVLTENFFFHTQQDGRISSRKVENVTMQLWLKKISWPVWNACMSIPHLRRSTTAVDPGPQLQMICQVIQVVSIMTGLQENFCAGNFFAFLTLQGDRPLPLYPPLALVQSCRVTFLPKIAFLS